MNREIAKKLPSLPGVYLFKDADLAVIYVGKAKSLKDRVSSYFNPSDDWKIKTLLAEAKSIDYILTKNEEEALLLEAQIIQEHQPRYNTLLKNGQPFIYLLVTQPTTNKTKKPHSDLPQLEITRNKKRKGKYYGPFIHKKQARKVLYYLIRTFRLRICKASIESGCLDYHLDLCSGTCKKNFDREGYLFRLQLAQQLIKNNYKKSQKDLNLKIKQLSKELKFEKAKYFSDFLQNLEPIYNTINCFDISHFQSASIVGSCIRFKNGVPDKNKFRRFKVRTIEQQDDCAALQEIVARRYRNPEDLPDLILIDGGKGQRNAVKHLFPQATFISLAKREERLFSDARPEGIVLDLQDDTGKMLIALRDYAHHFAITYHRKRQQKKIRAL